MRWNIKEAVSFSKTEWTEFIVIVLVLAFARSFDKWGTDAFDAQTGLVNLALAIAFVSVTLFVHNAAQRAYGASIGYKVEQKIWWYGLAFSLLIAAASAGKLGWYMATGTYAAIIAHRRIGKFYFGPNVEDMGMIALMGPLANVLLSGVAETLYFTTGAAWLHEVFLFNLLFAAQQLVPIPPLDGSRVFFASRGLYIAVFAAISTYVLLLFFFAYYSYLIAVIVGIVAWILWYALFELKHRKVL
ncbi:hypothetical protein HY642_02130 [Candidatus Woesearchaeota archaeon]|nr:hypothetical protein [Candidatus Woesearchaeota archaeon]